MVKDFVSGEKEFVPYTMSNVRAKSAKSCSDKKVLTDGCVLVSPPPPVHPGFFGVSKNVSREKGGRKAVAIF